MTTNTLCSRSALSGLRQTVEVRSSRRAGLCEAFTVLNHFCINLLSTGPFLSDFKKGELVRLMKDGSTIKHVAEKLGISTKTVGRWWKRHQEEGEAGLVSRRGNSGRKKKTTAEQDKAMVEVSVDTVAPLCLPAVSEIMTFADLC